MASVLDQLASALGQKEQGANITLAQKIAAGKDAAAVAVLVQALAHKTKAIRHDSIKTLYETAVLEPALLTSYATQLLSLLDDKDNRMQWGAMTALSAMTKVIPEVLYDALDKISAVAGSGSVISRDHAVKILATLATHSPYQDTAIPLLLDQLLQAPVNQAPSYAEQILPVVTAPYRDHLKKILLTRLDDTEQESKRKRLEKVLKKL